MYKRQVQYGAGEREFPKLGYAAQLMNNAGIMGAYEPQELKEEPVSYTHLAVYKRQFLFMNVNVIRGFNYLCKRKGNASGAWEKARRA